MVVLGTRLQRGLFIALLLVLTGLTAWAFTAYQSPSFAFGLANLLTLCGF
jgi:hypothetical protein